MSKEIIILSVDHRDILKEFLIFSASEFGNIKMNEIIEKINSSKKVARFLIEAKKVNERLGTDDYLSCIHSSSGFFFSKAEQIAIAAVTLLMKWDNEIGYPRGLSDDVYLNKTFFFILEKCDKLKTHINSEPNFFERFNQRIVSLANIFIHENSPQVIKNEIEFDQLMCKAIKTDKKTQFLVDDNFSIINLEPNEWEFIGYELNFAAKFKNNFLNKNIKITLPYKLGEYINIINKTDKTLDCRIRLTSGYVTRLKDLTQSDAEREGYGIYKDKIDKILLQDPSEDAEYLLFQKDCRSKFGNRCLVKNQWAFVFEFDNCVLDISSKVITQEMLNREIALKAIDFDDLIGI